MEGRKQWLRENHKPDHPQPKDTEIGKMLMAPGTRGGICKERAKRRIQPKIVDGGKQIHQEIQVLQLHQASKEG